MDSIDPAQVWVEVVSDDNFHKLFEPGNDQLNRASIYIKVSVYILLYSIGLKNEIERSEIEDKGIKDRLMGEIERF